MCKPGLGIINLNFDSSDSSLLVQSRDSAIHLVHPGIEHDRAVTEWCEFALTKKPLTT